MFKLYFQNVNGLRCKQNDLYEAVCDSDYDCIVLVETRLSRNILSSKLFPDYYEVFRHDRSKLNSSKKSGGGVLIAMHKRFNCRLLESNERIEHVAVEVNITDELPIVISNSYIPPKFPVVAYTEHLNTIIWESASINVPILVLGDFNLPNIRWEHQGNRMICQTKNNFVNSLHSKKLDQINSICNDNRRMLDLIFTNMRKLWTVKRATAVLIEEKELNNHKAVVVELLL